MSRFPNRATRSFLIIVALAHLALLPSVPIASHAQVVRPTVSPPTIVAQGEGNQTSPSLAGSVMAYADCFSPAGLCGVRVLDLSTGESYSVAQTLERSYFGGEAQTDGVTVVWTDARAVPEAGSILPTENTDIYGANLSDNSTFPITTAPGRQDEPAVSGKVVAWTDFRAARDADGRSAGDIYMYDLTARKETRVTSARGEQSRPHTDGRYIVYEDHRANPNSNNPTTDIYAYEIATGREFAVSTAPGIQGDPFVSGNWIVWTDYGTTFAQADIFAYDLTTRRTTRVTTARNQQTRPVLSGNLLVYEDNRNQPEVQGIGPQVLDLYGYDLGTRQEFEIARSKDRLSRAPSVSGNRIAWVNEPNLEDGKADIVVATVSGVPAVGATPNQPQPPASRDFPQTGKRVEGRFLQYWLRNGGLPQQGYPISGVMTEVSDLDGKPYRVQYFERAVFEEHPENKPPYDVLLSQLGTFRLRQKYSDPARIPASGPPPGQIAGRLEFPSEGIPELEIYAIPVNPPDNPVYSVRSWTNQLEYVMEGVAPGDYYVLAYIPLEGGIQTMAYTKAVKCRLEFRNAECPDQSLLAVRVESGKRTQDINPVDYTGDASKYPPRPNARVEEGTCRTFTQTGKTVCGLFLHYWLRNGGLAQQGLPLTDPFTEVSDLDGKPYRVQYFERAVFELHPEHRGTPFEVLLSQLGTFRYREKYP